MRVDTAINQSKSYNYMNKKEYSFSQVNKIQFAQEWLLQNFGSFFNTEQKSGTDTEKDIYFLDFSLVKGKIRALFSFKEFNEVEEQQRILDSYHSIATSYYEHSLAIESLRIKEERDQNGSATANEAVWPVELMEEDSEIDNLVFLYNSFENDLKVKLAYYSQELQNIASGYSEPSNSYKETLNVLEEDMISVDTYFFRPLPKTVQYTGLFENYTVRKAIYSEIEPDYLPLDNLNYYVKSRKLLNPSTKLAIFTVNSFNHSLNSLSTTNIYLEQNKFQQVSTKIEVCVIDDFDEVNYLRFTTNLDSNLFQALTKLLVYFLILGYVLFSSISIVTGLWKKGVIGYLKVFWNAIKVLKIVLFAVSLFLRGFTAYFIISDIDTESTGFIDTSRVCQSFKAMRAVETWMIVVVNIYFLRFVDESIIIAVFNTLMRIKKSVLVFCCSFLFSVAGFSMFAVYAYGTSIFELHTFNQSFYYIFYMIFGDGIILTKMNTALPFITLIFIGMFCVSTYILFTNWINATIIYSYETMNSELNSDKQAMGTTELDAEFDLIKNKIIRLLLMTIQALKEYLSPKKLLEIVKIDCPKKRESTAEKDEKVQENNEEEQKEGKTEPKEIELAEFK